MPMARPFLSAAMTALAVCLMLSVDACKTRTPFSGRVEFSYEHGQIAAVAIQEHEPYQELRLSNLGGDVERDILEKINSAAARSNLKTFFGTIQVVPDKLGMPPGVDYGELQILCPDISDMHGAAESNDVDRIRYLLSHGHAVDERYPMDMRTPLMWAASGSLHAAKVLLDSGAQPNLRAYDGTSALHLAASAGSVDMIHLLISRGADVNIESQDGDTPIMAAVDSGYPAAAKALIAAGADVNHKDIHGVSACKLPRASDPAFRSFLKCAAQ